MRIQINWANASEDATADWKELLGLLANERAGLRGLKHGSRRPSRNEREAGRIR